MPDTTSEGWQELQTTSRRQCPKLFYSFSTEEQSLTLLLTDLISIWECSLDKYDILAAAARQQTSIDPSVSSDQLGVLLSKIRTSLGDGANSLIRGGRANSRTLLLRTRTDLPRPLRPLEWTFTLEPQRASELAERVLRPSLHEVFVSQNKINSLLGIIKDKDHIISRLLDRVGNSAVDLSLVFPGIAGFASRKGGHVSVADAKKHVPGMTSFDEKSWTRQFANDEGYEGADRTGLSNLVRGCEKCFAHSKAEHESWVKDLPSTEKPDQNDDASRNQSVSPSTKASKDEIKEPDRDDESTDDEFERQATPPHLKSKDVPKKTTRENTADEETEDDEPVPKRAQPSTIGGLGRRNATKAFGASKRSPSPVDAAVSKSPSSRRASTASTSTATASEVDDAADQRFQAPVAPQNKSSHLTQKSKIGALRSRKASDSPSPPAPAARPGSSTSSTGRAAEQEPPSHNVRVAARGSKTPEAGGEEEEEENDDLNDTSSTASASPPPTKAKPSTPAHERRRLGRLGGGGGVAKKQATPPSPDTSKGKDTPDSAHTESPAKRKPGRLGGLRKRARDTTTSPSPRAQGKEDATNTQSPSASRSPSQSSSATSRSRTRNPALATTRRQRQRQDHSPPPPPPGSTRTKPAIEPRTNKKEEETPEEAASRRRMELKRTIAATDGAKKKRRF
ncbi:hypothetical protein Z517_04425 [Fonsecaea pedrosoi CBS 271.37]|uniref:Non-homologous end-joining factor 1 n=1 Tax=Fonsecaea pedrosoi CBS 271.37 TaxID=1442368 RepID=A0A0D2GS84_9EURO|nr:uncharacterized protein Z517_04425 [Fonsecaea pedrosoi CBS 271.37]KIW81400.1 hypothetical protein Z517_04425 [Fonsecaea pedrosoi CBS 271.37]